MQVYAPLGYEQITSLSTATGLTVPAGSVRCLLQAETQNVRLRDDGVSPTATVGMIITAGGVPFPYEGDLAALKVIEAAASAKLNVLYYTERSPIR